MEKRAIISVKSTSNLDPNEVIEVVTPGLLLMNLDLRQYMKNRKYQEWTVQLLL